MFGPLVGIESGASIVVCWPQWQLFNICLNVEKFFLRCPPVGGLRNPNVLLGVVFVLLLVVPRTSSTTLLRWLINLPVALLLWITPAQTTVFPYCVVVARISLSSLYWCAAVDDVATFSPGNTDRGPYNRLNTPTRERVQTDTQRGSSGPIQGGPQQRFKMAVTKEYFPLEYLNNKRCYQGITITITSHYSISSLPLC